MAQGSKPSGRIGRWATANERGEGHASTSGVSGGGGVSGVGPVRRGSAGNTYTTDVTDNLGVSDLTAICSTHSIAAQLGTGATITVNWTGTAPNGQLLLVHAFAVTGLAGAALDQTASTASTGPSASSGATAATGQANELLVPRSWTRA